MKKINILLSLILTAAVVQAAFMGFMRWQVEQANNTVELVADYADLEQAAAASYYRTENFLSDLKALGITSVALLEQAPAEAAVAGELYFASGEGILRFKGISGFLDSYAGRGLIISDRSYFFIEDEVVRKRVLAHLAATFGEKKINYLGSKVIEVNERSSEVADLGIGFSESTLKKLKGFHVIPRLANNPRYNISQKIALFKNFDTVVFDGEEILGYPDKITELAGALRRNNLKYGHVEIIKQLGNTQLKNLSGEGMIRVHSISQDEIKKTRMDVAVDRFKRAVKERGIRMLYLRPYLPPVITAAPCTYNLAYFSAVRQAVTDAGFLIGRASSPASIQLTRSSVIIIGLGAIVGLIMLINAFFELGAVITIVLLAFSALGLCFYDPPGLSLEQCLAAVAAVVFPSMAVITTYTARFRLKNIYLSALAMLANVTAEAALGAILVVGLLADTRFMLGSLDFRGVKITLLFPVIITAAYFLIKGDDPKLDIRKFIGRIRTYLGMSVPLAYFLSGAAGVALFIVLLARSDNFIIPVLDSEKILRGLLEDIMWIRPRFKEFLIGYPLLFISAVLSLKGEKKWLWVFLAAGAIGPASLLNTFSHIHSPLNVSILRSLSGLIIGALLGLLASLLLKK